MIRKHHILITGSVIQVFLAVGLHDQLWTMLLGLGAVVFAGIAGGLQYEHMLIEAIGKSDD